MKRLFPLMMIAVWLVPATVRADEKTYTIPPAGESSLSLSLHMLEGELRVGTLEEELVSQVQIFDRQPVFRSEFVYELVEDTGFLTLVQENYSTVGEFPTGPWPDQWAVTVSRVIPLNCLIRLDKAEGDIDLSGARLGSLTLHLDRGRISVSLPSPKGKDAVVRLENRNGLMDIHLPPDADVFVKSLNFSGDMEMDGFEEDEAGYWRMASDTPAEHRLLLTVEGGNGRFRLQ